jgi:hypothetical protein
MYKYSKYLLDLEKASRYHDHVHRVRQFREDIEVLDPKRIINRVIYGPDYDSKTVGFNFYHPENGWIYS